MPAGALRFAAVLGLLSAALVFTAGVGTADTAEPRLSITVDNGRSAAAVGDTAEYTITVRNLGTEDVVGLGVTQSVPTGLAFGSADTDGTAQEKGVSWPLDLKAGGQAVFHSTMTVSETPAELLRLATVACAGLVGDQPPIVCASDSDQLPAGASADAARAAPASGNILPWWYPIGGVLLLVALLTVLALRRRRRQ